MCSPRSHPTFLIFNIISECLIQTAFFHFIIILFIIHISTVIPGMFLSWSHSGLLTHRFICWAGTHCTHPLTWPSWDALCSCHAHGMKGVSFVTLVMGSYTDRQTERNEGRKERFRESGKGTTEHTQYQAAVKFLCMVFRGGEVTQLKSYWVAKLWLKVSKSDPLWLF